MAILAGIEARSGPDGSLIHVNPALPDWLPKLRLSNLRAGRGSLTIELEDGRVDVISNTTGFRLSPQSSSGVVEDRSGTAKRAAEAAAR